MQPQYYGAAAGGNRPKGFGAFKGKLLIIIIGVVAGLIVVGLFFTILGSLTSGPKNNVARLIARTQQLRTLLETEQKNIRDPALKKVSAEAELFLGTSDLALQNVLGGDLPENIVAEETDSTITDKLTTATQAGRHDQEFAAVFRQKVALILELSQKVQSQAGQQSKAAATQLTNDTKSISEQLELITL